MPAVPKAAVLMEAGRPYVFVQTGGERFARRFIEVAARDGDLVGIKSGRQARRARGDSRMRTTCSWRRRPRACRPKGTCTE